MAGGEGRRLKPVTGPLPKPMVPLLGKPLMERCVEHLRENGITELCATLRYNPGVIMDYFGDGERFGVRLHWRVETQPLGTAGGVKACMDLVGDGDFLVVSGDALCSYDLRRLAREHAESGAAATIALARRADPLRYGVAVTDRGGFIRCFIEKPDWPRVVGDLVSTGIYVVSPRAMETLDRVLAFDFAHDLFPALLERGERIRGVEMPGYWCDVGTPEAYYQCCLDVLAGRLSPEQPAPASAAPRAKAAPPARGGARRRVPCADRAALMRALAGELMECGADFSDGLTLRSAHCTAHIAPEAEESALSVEASAGDGAFAEALAGSLAALAARLGGESEPPRA